MIIEVQETIDSNKNRRTRNYWGNSTLPVWKAKQENAPLLPTLYPNLCPPEPPILDHIPSINVFLILLWLTAISPKTTHSPPSHLGIPASFLHMLEPSYPRFLHIVIHRSNSYLVLDIFISIIISSSVPIHIHYNILIPTTFIF